MNREAIHHLVTPGMGLDWTAQIALNWQFCLCVKNFNWNIVLSLLDVSTFMNKNIIRLFLRQARVLHSHPSFTPLYLRENTKLRIANIWSNYTDNIFCKGSFVIRFILIHDQNWTNFASPLCFIANLSFNLNHFHSDESKVFCEIQTKNIRF